MLNYFMYLILWKSLGLREKSFFLLSTRKLTLLIAWFTCIKAINMLSGTLYSPIAEPKTWIVCVWDYTALAMDLNSTLTIRSCFPWEDCKMSGLCGFQRRPAGHPWFRCCLLRFIGAVSGHFGLVITSCSDWCWLICILVAQYDLNESVFVLFCGDREKYS